MNRPEFTATNAPKIAEVKLSSYGLELADSKKNCDCGIAELRSNISLKVAELRLWKRFLLVAELRLRTPKKSCACPPLFIRLDNNIVVMCCYHLAGTI
jgi:hypothetical protein